VRRVLTVALFTFRELIRSNLLIVWIVSVIAISGLSFLLSILSYGDALKIFTDLGLAGTELAGWMVLLLSLAVTYTTEMDQKAIFLQLAKPVTRGEYLLGRVIGFFLLNLLVVLGNVVFLAFMVVVIGDGTIPAYFISSVLFMVLEMLVLTFLGLTYQMIATSMVRVVLYTLFTILLGRLIGEIQWLLDKQPAGFVKWVLTVVYYCLPNLQIFDLKDRIYDPNLVVGLVQWQEVFLYSFFYSSVVFLIGWLSLEKREFR
jgi:ABC-type transport system involved in multi-copper enzyme maturation permease subunit